MSHKPPHVWLETPPDNTKMKVQEVPPSFVQDGAFCIECGGGTDMEWFCVRCGADHWPAVKKQRDGNSSASSG